MRWKAEIKEMNFKKIIIEKYYFFVEKNDFENFRNNIFGNIDDFKGNPFVFTLKYKGISFEIINISENMFSKMFKIIFLHEKIIFFDDFFSKVHLLDLSFPTHLLSAPESQNSANGWQNTV